MASHVDALPAMTRRRLSPAPASLLIMLAAWLPFLPMLAMDWPLSNLVLMQGAAALLLSRWFRLPLWWQVINTGFFPLLWLVYQADIEPIWFLAGFALLALTSLGSLKTRVPLYLSSQRAVEAVAGRVPAQARVLDLGCGLGGWLASLKTRRPDLVLAGVEVAPLNWLASRLRLNGKAAIRLGSLWEEDLSDYDVVYAYLSPAPMAELWRKVEREMRPGSLFISNTFAVPGIEPDETVELKDLSHARLLIWRR
ncbi:MAG: class I SAM-dependent methyltransferase [Gallionellaceae bacterium]|nr:class I SAM-dependent methyltransferase [Gallionellaceae bacterium]